MTLDMSGFIDADFISMPANQITQTGGDYDGDGIWQSGTESSLPYAVNIQPLNDRELNNLNIGGERVQDYRKIYVNDGDFHALSSDAFWEFDANNSGIQRYKAIKSDVRESRAYAKITVVLIDG
jgi:hypothetical protein